MKNITPSENYSDLNSNENASSGHTEKLNNTRSSNIAGEQNKPQREIKTWCSYMESGFRASREAAEPQDISIKSIKKISPSND